MKTPDTTIDLRATDSTRRGILVMIFSVAGFCINTLLLKYISQTGRGVNPETPMFFRAAVGMFIVLVFFRGRRPTRVAPVFTNRLLILRGLTGLLGTAAYYWTVPKLGAGMATLICNTYVIFASLIAVLALGERLTLRRFSWMAAAFVGIVLLVGQRAENSVGVQFLGFYEIVALAGAVLAASSVVLVRRLTEEFSIGTIYFAQCVWILAPTAVFVVPGLLDLAAIDWCLLIVAATAASYGQLAMNEGYRCLSVSLGASLQMLWPVSTVIGGWLLFDEQLAGLQFVGACIILASVWRLSVAKPDAQPGSGRK